MVCDPEAETLTIHVKRCCLGCVFKSCLSPTSYGHINLRDVIAFSARFYHSRKSSSTSGFQVTTEAGTTLYRVEMDVSSGRHVEEWMNTYLHHRTLQNAQTQDANNMHMEEEIRVESAPPSD